MGKIVKIGQISEDAMQFLKDNYGIDPNKLKEIQNKELKVSDEILEAFRESQGVLEYEIMEEKSEDEVADDEVKDNEKDKETSEKTPRTQKEVEYLKTRAIKMLEKLDAYKNMPQEAREEIKSVYEKTTDIGDIWDKNFLDKRLNKDEMEQFVAGANQMHKAILGGLAIQNHMRNNQNDADVEVDESEIDEKSAQGANQMIVRMPRVVKDMEPYLKDVAQNELADKLKKYIELATNSSSTIEALVIMGDIKGHAEKIKEEYQVSADNSMNDAEKEAIKLYISQMPVTEMGAVMMAMQEATSKVTLSFDDIDWNNEVERNVALNLLSETHKATHELGATEPAMDVIKVDFDVNNMQDISSMKTVCEKLKDIGVDQGVEVKAAVNISENLDEEEREKLEKAADEVLNSNEIKSEQKKTDILEEVAKEGISEATGEETATELAMLAGTADVVPLELAQALEEIIENTQEFKLPGTGGSST